MRRFALSVLLPLLAACGDSTGPVTTAEVGGVYQVCSLVFTPAGNTLQPVDIRVAATDTSPGITNPSRLTLSTQVREFELQYTPKNDVLPQRPRGTYETRANTVGLVFAEPARVASALLLPARLGLDFQASPKALVVAQTQGSYRVPRADYARLAGVSQTNLPTEIEGSLAGRFVELGAACS